MSPGNTHAVFDDIRNALGVHGVDIRTIKQRFDLAATCRLQQEWCDVVVNPKPQNGALECREPGTDRFGRPGESASLSQ